MADRERWQEMVEVAVGASRLGGEILQEWSDRFSVSEKSRANVVTEADFASQEAIFQKLQTAFPDHAFLGEEGLSHQVPGAEYLWIIDPLDGTGNYVHQFPYYCVSIGLQYQNRMIAGVIYDPTRDELFVGLEGCGATRNGKPIRVSQIESLSQAMCAASLPVSGDSTHPAFGRFVRVLPKAQSVQRLGSAALNLAYVASGYLDIFWSSTLKPWDMAAGAVIVQEAGGLITNLSGGPYDVHQTEILAVSGPVLQGEILPCMEDVTS